jgi:hypothetical protein
MDSEPNGLGLIREERRGKMLYWRQDCIRYCAEECLKRRREKGLTDGDDEGWVSAEGV